MNLGLTLQAPHEVGAAVDELPQERAWHRHVLRNFAAERAQAESAAEQRVGAAADAYAASVLARSVRPFPHLLSGQIYFGRLDDDEGQMVYVGRMSIRELVGPRPESHRGVVERVVTNWQARAARPFYDPLPKGVTGRRRYDFVGGELASYSTETWGARRSQPKSRTRPKQTTAKAAGPVADPPIAPSMPQADVQGMDQLLADLSRSREPQMRDIVTTIQADQYALLEHEPHVVLAVQGAPGTGKTAVVLHRLSMVGFRHPDIRSRGLLMIGPNRRFIDYVSKVLPGLGDDDVHQSTADDISGWKAGRDEGTHAAQIKGDERMAVLLDTAVARAAQPPPEALVLTFARRRLRVNRGAATSALLRAKADTYEGRRDRLLRSLADLFASQFTEAVGGLGELRASGHPDPAGELRQGASLRRIVDRLLPPLTPEDVLRELWASTELLLDSADGVLTVEEVESLIEAADTGRRPGVWTTADLPLLDELSWLLSGAPKQVGHIAVDEAQDLTPMQLRMIGRRRGTRTGVTLVGDLAQATGPCLHHDWHEIVRHVAPGSEPHIGELTRGYRVPAAALAIANQVLPHTGVRVPSAVPLRHIDGALRVFPVADEVSVALWAVERALTLADGDQAVAMLIAGGEVHVSAAERERARGAKISILAPTEAKGLEFDHVVVAEPADIVAEAGTETAGARALFVALTRATRSLSIVHQQPLPYGITVSAVTEMDGEDTESPAVTQPVRANAEPLTLSGVEPPGTSVTIPRPRPTTRNADRKAESSRAQATHRDLRDLQGRQVFVSQRAHVWHAQDRCYGPNAKARPDATTNATAAFRSSLQPCPACTADLLNSLKGLFGSIPSGERRRNGLPALAPLPPSSQGRRQGSSSTARTREDGTTSYGEVDGSNDPRLSSTSTLGWGASMFRQAPDEFLGSGTDDDHDWRGNHNILD